MRFKFNPGSYAPFYPDNHRGCVGGCDPNFMELLGIRPLATQQRNQNHQQPSNTSVANDTSNSSGYASGSQLSEYSANDSRSSEFAVPSAPLQRPGRSHPASSNNTGNAARNFSGSGSRNAPSSSTHTGARERSIPSQSNHRPNESHQPRPLPQRPEIDSK